MLLGKDYIAKVSDYGMARDVYEQLMYKKETQVIPDFHLLKSYSYVKGAVSREVFYVFCVNYARIIKVHSMINKKPLTAKMA